jgi:hypothetical protein
LCRKLVVCQNMNDISCRNVTHCHSQHLFITFIYVSNCGHHSHAWRSYIEKAKYPINSTIQGHLFLSLYSSGIWVPKACLKTMFFIPQNSNHLITCYKFQIYMKRHCSRFLLWTSDQPVAETSTYTGQHNT